MDAALELDIVAKHVEEYAEHIAAMKASLATEKRVARNVSRLFGNVEKEMLKQLKAKGLTVDPKQLEKALRNYMAPLEDVLTEAALVEQEEARKRIVKLANSAGIFVDADAPLPDKVTQALLQHVFEASLHTINRVTDDLMGVIAKAFDEGKGIKEIAKDVKGRFRGLKGYEAKRIARTEVNYAQNRSAYDTMVQHGIQYHKWVTGLDARVRGLKPTDSANHVVLQSQCTKVGNAFGNGLLYPGDRGGRIAEWINCRCTSVPWTPPPGKMPPPGLPHWNELDVVDDPAQAAGMAGAVTAVDTRDWSKTDEWVNDDQYLGLNTYSGGSYGDINRALRGMDKLEDLPPHLLDAIDYCDDAFRIAPKLADDLTVFRGSSGEYVFNALEEGAEFGDLGFMSTSTSKKQAQSFASGYNACLVELKLPKGTNAINLKPVSKCPWEDEVLLPRGSRFKVTEVRIEEETGRIPMASGGYRQGVVRRTKHVKAELVLD